MLDRFEAAVEILGLGSGVVQYLKIPAKQVVVAVPRSLDDGSVEVYTGYRVIHNNNRGPAEGEVSEMPPTSRSARSRRLPPG